MTKGFLKLKYSEQISLSAVLKSFKLTLAQGSYRYTSDKIQEYDMGTHLLLLYASTTYSKTGKMLDKGT